MRQLKIKSIHVLLFTFFLCWSCVEEIDLQSETAFENILVVEATITDEIKHQEIKLSRSFPLETDGPVLESGAQVKVITNNEVYVFQELQAGTYVSNEAFAALQNVEYSLEIITSNGKIYESSNEVLSGESVINNMNYEIGFNENNALGISIFVAPENGFSSSELYRYTYEETYKIIAPFYSPQELIPLISTTDFPFNIAEEFENFTTLTEIIDYLVELRFRDQQEQVCYNTVRSNDIILKDVNDFINGDLSSKRIRFISKANYIISHRYSILVKQYGQSQKAHTFYRILRDLSENESLFSALQPGFFNGNVVSLTDSNEKVAGFFEVSSVDQQRIYFNYSDVFPEDDLPPYVVECNDLLFPKLLVDDGDGNAVSSPLISDLDDGKQLYLLNGYEDDASPLDAAPFTLVLRPCGDCTILGNTQPPDFWED